jgi:dTDP-4-dehydrorhamnose 3,5-epimerase
MTQEERITFSELEIKEVYALKLFIARDERGSLTRIWEQNSPMSQFGICQSSYVVNPLTGTLRGIHFQLGTNWEFKIVQCIAGKVFDVVVDLRANSNTYKKYLAVNIGPDCEYQGLLIPPGCAHGYLTQENNSSLIYFMDKSYSKDQVCGIRWNEPELNIKWPSTPTLISQQDLNWPYLGK